MSLPTRFILSIACLLVAPGAAQDIEETGGLPPVLKGLDLRGDRDGQIQRDELTENLQRFFDSTDLNGDGVLTWHEVDEAKAARIADLPTIVDVTGEMDSTTLDLLGGVEYEVGWSEGKLHDAGHSAVVLVARSGDRPQSTELSRYPRRRTEAVWLLRAGTCFRLRGFIFLGAN